jgi:AcrR family transcriptional regulator
VTKKPPKKPATQRARRADGETTRARILTTALDLFRRRGFDETTMRDIATGAGVSLGAAYHYFRSKEEIAIAFYRELQQHHAEDARRALVGARSLRERLDAVFSSALDVRGGDRPVFAALTRTVIDATSPASLFAGATADVRDNNVALMREVATCDEVSEELREPLAYALWALELGLLLRFVHDDSPGQSVTRKLMAGALDLVPSIVMLLGMPMMQPMRAQLLRVLADGGLMPASPLEPARTEG